MGSPVKNIEDWVIKCTRPTTRRNCEQNVEPKDALEEARAENLPLQPRSRRELLPSHDQLSGLKNHHFDRRSWSIKFQRTIGSKVDPRTDRVLIVIVGNCHRHQQQQHCHHHPNIHEGILESMLREEHNRVDFDFSHNAFCILSCLETNDVTNHHVTKVLDWKMEIHRLIYR